MKIIRPIKPQDQSFLEQFAFATGIGLTSMPKDKALLHHKIMQSQDAFSDQVYGVGKPPHYLYIFVLEDLETGSLLGSCSIRAKTGGSSPLYFYRRETWIVNPDFAEKSQEVPLLSPVSYTSGPTELLGLYMTPVARKAGLGKLLSFSRLLFLANMPHRFDRKVKAEIRGFIDDQLNCPFWNGIGRNFCDLPITKILEMASHSKNFAAEILPKHPIYIPLLPKPVQDVIGAAHPHALPAVNMLMAQGFKPAKEIDIFDGGPILECPLTEIKTIKESRSGLLSEISSKPISSTPLLISNVKLDFRACLGTLQEHWDGGIILPEPVAEALQVNVGDAIRYVPI